MFRLWSTTRSQGRLPHFAFGDAQVATDIVCARYQADYVSETGRLSCNVKVAPFAGVEVPAELEKELPLLVKPALEPAVVLSRFPKSVVEIHILVLEQEGDVVSAAITCASLAMADAEIEMFDLVAASSVAVHSRKSRCDLRPAAARAVHCSVLTLRIRPARRCRSTLRHRTWRRRAGAC